MPVHDLATLPRPGFPFGCFLWLGAVMRPRKMIPLSVADIWIDYWRDALLCSALFDPRGCCAIVPPHLFLGSFGIFRRRNISAAIPT
jgi:hypothetical protein